MFIHNKSWKSNIPFKSFYPGLKAKKRVVHLPKHRQEDAKRDRSEVKSFPSSLDRYQAILIHASFPDPRRFGFAGRSLEQGTASICILRTLATVVKVASATSTIVRKWKLVYELNVRTQLYIFFLFYCAASHAVGCKWCKIEQKCDNRLWG